MSVFGFTEVSAVAAFSAFCAWATHVRAKNAATVDFLKEYGGEQNEDEIKQKLEFFSWTWVPETILLTITLFYFAQNTLADSWNIIAGTVLFFTHLFSIHVRNVLFWKMHKPKKALMMAWPLIVMTVVGFYISMTLHNIQGLFWVPIIPFSIYTVWTCAITGWMYRVYAHHYRTKYPDAAPSKTHQILLYTTDPRRWALTRRVPYQKI